MSMAQLFGMFGGLLVLAYVANRLFQWTRVPDVVVRRRPPRVPPSTSRLGAS